MSVRTDYNRVGVDPLSLSEDPLHRPILNQECARRDTTLPEAFCDLLEFAMLSANLPCAIVPNRLRTYVVANEVGLWGDYVDER